MDNILINTPEKVIFDMDGLIFDSERVFMRELRAVAKNYGYDITEEKYVQTLGLTGDTLLKKKTEQYGEDYPHYELSRQTRDRVDAIALSEGLPVQPGIKELLTFLNDSKIPCAVASSTHTEYVEKYLAASGLRGYFDTVIGGDMAERSKPEPDIFLISAGSTPPGKALVLEDSANGIIAASRAGIPVICIPDMTYPTEEIRKLTAGVVSTAADVIDIIRRTM
ncbi:MAG: HAD family hydrolase [Candidatus Ornithomonoglobus sp.]